MGHSFRGVRGLRNWAIARFFPLRRISHRPSVKLGVGLGLGLLLSLLLNLLMAHRVSAAQTVILQFRDQRLSVPYAELATFAAQKTLSEPTQALLIAAEIEPDAMHHWLTQAIALPNLDALPERQFILLQINKTVGDPLGSERLDEVETALRRALRDDGAFSVLELLQQYPQPAVRLEVGRLEQAYTDVELVVNRLLPVLRTVQTLLPELVCDCAATLEATRLNVQPGDQAQTAAAGWTEAAAAIAPAIHSPPIESSFQTTALAGAIASEKNRLVANTGILADPSASPKQTASAQAVPPLPNFANRRLVIALGPLRPSISIGELTTFAETGYLSPGWRSMLRIAKIAPDQFREALNDSIKANAVNLDEDLNSILGEYALFKIGEVIQTSSNRANIQALRSTLVLSASGDGQFTLLELLQRYPTSQIVLNGSRLIRLGQLVNRAPSTGDGAIAFESWLLNLQASAAETVCDCNVATPRSPVPKVAIAPEKVAEFLPANWQPVPAHREEYGPIKVVWLAGTPYDMGYQHGTLLHNEIASIGERPLRIARLAGVGLGLGRLAKNRAFPELLEECRGMADAASDIGIDMDVCTMMSYADVFQEILGYTLPRELFWEGCNQFVATNAATKDGHLYHGSSVDNNEKPVDYVVYNPILFIRQPLDGLPHVFVTYPGVIWPNSGVNVAGISLGLDTAHAADITELSREGRSNVQIMGQILKTATSFAEARSLMETQPRVRGNIIMITDGKSREAGVFEFTGRHLGVRPLQDNGVLYATNHFVLPEMFERQPLPIDLSSDLRFRRLGQLLEPDGISSRYGEIDPTVVAEILRDRTHPITLEASPFDVFDDDASPGGNGALRQAIYDPMRLKVWIAAGDPPVPQNPFRCFAVGQLLGFPNAAGCNASSIP
ncbi:C45 family autoproteolytic acyltransferase/hydrolase [Thermoleptolyngbya sichuanensis XZ-Cy5]|uniref:C45 family autoproteolytic acyltransferase/hydolase n=1 Tax=Thermoleptolyngbya sichuanensis TaxID=2885951 RepID=UPI00240E825E|nr:C45 family autoproteolytic acyltransferase/hydolase [Thermoleptolyngbya sichuanensis]MDG2614680.1 C45 family autoproteolytic acyltransferase/hydrolase [Thermoleptolyngbya sichuanensis XZ-Cy5]